MKVKCIENVGCVKLLTIGKTYDVILISKMGNYIIIDDSGISGYYHKEWFKIIVEYRNDKINKLLEDES